MREYEPAQFEVDVTVEPAKVRGDKIDVEVKGKYLYGGPMRGSSVNYLVQRGASWFRPPESDGFTTDASAYYSDLRERGIDAGTLRSEQRKLDELGLAKFSETLALPGQRGPELVTIEADVTDLARRTQSGQSTVLVHPAEFYLGIKLPESFVKATALVSPELIALTSDGKRLDGKRVKLELLERRWTWTREDRGGSHPETVSRVADRVLGSCELTSRTRGASCPLRVMQRGLSPAARALDRRPRQPVEAATGFYVFGPGETRWQGRDDGLVELVLDKQSYQVGDKAKVLIKSPFPEARALISVERASVLHHEQRVLSGSMPSFEVEVTEDFVPNAFVSVHLLKKLGKDAASQPGGAYRVGYAEIRIDPEPRRLAVELAPNAKVFAPGDELTLALKVRDRRGKAARAELTVYAVERGRVDADRLSNAGPVARALGTAPVGRGHARNSRAAREDHAWHLHRPARHGQG